MADADVKSLLKQYYRKQRHIESDLILIKERLYPFKEMHAWLSYGSGMIFKIVILPDAVERDYFGRREWSFTLPGDIYTRFRSFPDMESFAKQVKDSCPEKIDIGAVYSAPPANKAAYGAGFVPEEKELVFDIDMTDYDDIRTCCSGASVCDRCWVFMTVAIKVIHRVLREDFGFKHIVWVYSGRRGVHCWVCDKRARKLTAEGRSAIAEYISIGRGGEGKARKIEVPTKLPPSLRIALEQCSEHFVQVLIDQGVLDTEERQAKFLEQVPDGPFKNDIANHWAKKKAVPEKMWADFQTTAKDRGRNNRLGIDPVADVVFYYTYPRLDVNVSTGINHLLKAPFCLHPATLKVCIPIDPSKAEEFSPLKVPHVQQLLEEIDKFVPEPGKKVPRDLKKTSLRHDVSYFKKEFLVPLQRANALQAQVPCPAMSPLIDTYQEEHKMEF